MCWRAGDPWAPLNYQDPLFRLTSLHLRQTGGSIGGVLPLCRTAAGEFYPPSGWGSIQTDSVNKQPSNTAKTQKPAVNKKPEKPVRNSSPAKSPKKVLSDRLPKGSDDPIQQHNRFQSLDEDMEADTDHTEQNANKQGRIIKLNKR